MPPCAVWAAAGRRWQRLVYPDTVAAGADPLSVARLGMGAAARGSADSSAGAPERAAMRAAPALVEEYRRLSPKRALLSLAAAEAHSAWCVCAQADARRDLQCRPAERVVWQKMSKLKKKAWDEEWKLLKTCRSRRLTYARLCADRKAQSIERAFVCALKKLVVFRRGHGNLPRRGPQTRAACRARTPHYPPNSANWPVPAGRAHREETHRSCTRKTSSCWLRLSHGHRDLAPLEMRLARSSDRAPGSDRFRSKFRPPRRRPVEHPVVVAPPDPRRRSQCGDADRHLQKAAQARDRRRRPSSRPACVAEVGHGDAGAVRLIASSTSIASPRARREPRRPSPWPVRGRCRQRRHRGGTTRALEFGLDRSEAADGADRAPCSLIQAFGWTVSQRRRGSIRRSAPSSWLDGDSCCCCPPSRMRWMRRSACFKSCC